MFTGLIQNIGVVKSHSDEGGDRRFVIETEMDMGRVEMGASIACSGACMTVVDKGEGWFAIDVSGESLSKTVLESWEAGVKVNLEPSLKMGDELGGHIVSGHVDGVARLLSIEEEGGSHRLKIQAPDELAKFIAAKGSVTLDGISLTVNEVEGGVFGVNIIPHTWAHTTLSERQEGDGLNIEIDMLARYVARMLEVAA